MYTCRRSVDCEWHLIILDHDHHLSCSICNNFHRELSTVNLICDAELRAKTVAEIALFLFYLAYLLSHGFYHHVLYICISSLSGVSL